MTTGEPDQSVARAAFRIVSWNCNKALAEKARRLLDLRPDVAIVQECAATSELDEMVRIGWTGEYAYSGLAVFARSDLGVTVAGDVWDPTREWFLPVRVPSLGLDILASWAMHQRGHEDRPKQGRIHATMEHYRGFLAGGPALVIGDLNDNVIWDQKRVPSFARLTALLGEMGLINLYYERTGETPGAESQGSLYFYRHSDKSYLIDHAFLSGAWLARVADFKVGRASDWLDVSDHTPLILDLTVASK